MSNCPWDRITDEVSARIDIGLRLVNELQKTEDLESRLQDQSLLLSCLEVELEAQGRATLRAEKQAEQLASWLEAERARREEAETNGAWAWAMLTGLEEQLRSVLEVCESADNPLLHRTGVQEDPSVDGEDGSGYSQLLARAAGALEQNPCCPKPLFPELHGGSTVRDPRRPRTLSNMASRACSEGGESQSTVRYSLLEQLLMLSESEPSRDPKDGPTCSQCPTPDTCLPPAQGPSQVSPAGLPLQVSASDGQRQQHRSYEVAPAQARSSLIRHWIAAPCTPSNSIDLTSLRSRPSN
mmetsp:Transcript_7709/g.21929  ORF Transcript_7709/g.21929 Transcript_7709/m.21929 type:complete len:297 (-) Transcript_7709:2092-2982(-)